MNRIVLFRWLTLLGYFGLMAHIFIWLLWIEPLPAEKISLTILFAIGPLMFPLKGILHGKVYTHAWSMYMALFYFVIGIWFAGAEEDRLYGILISTFSLIFFIGTMFYTRFKGRADKQLSEQEPS